MPRWIVASDIHGDKILWSLILQTAKSTRDLSAIIICGDLTQTGLRNFQLGDGSLTFASLLLAKDYLEKLAKIAPVYYIQGNHDIGFGPNTFNLLNVLDISDQTVEIDGLSVRGIVETPAWNAPELAKVWWRMVTTTTEDATVFDLPQYDVLVSHGPPLGCLDYCGNGHIGSPALKNYIAENRPYMVLCGHVHEQGGQSEMLYKTKVINMATTYTVISVESIRNGN